MQTRKLIAGETLLLEEEKGFCLVVDGLVQIFVKSTRDENTSDGRFWTNGGDGFDDEGEHSDGEHQGYQLLTEVKNGAPMSSLFSVLSLFTEDVKLRHDLDHDGGPISSASSHGFSGMTPSNGPGSPQSYFPETSTQLETDRHRSRAISEAASHNPTPPNGHLPAVPPLSLDPTSNLTSKQQYARGLDHDRSGARGKPDQRKSVHPDIVARATVDTTIAIIPATAFHRLTRVYPKATAHIVQVILTRLQRVTLATAHSYLGLTSEVLRTERHMNKYTTYDLPNHLRGEPLDRLKGKFMQEKERLDSEEESMKGIALHNPGGLKKRRSSSSLRKDIIEQARMITRNEAQSRAPNNRDMSDQRSNISAGDLLTNTHVSRSSVRHPNSTSASQLPRIETLSPTKGHDLQTPLGRREHSPFRPSPPRSGLHIHRQDSLDEDDIFRQSILECILKAIGLTNAKDAIRKPVDSVQQSPRLVSYDAQYQKATFSNAFGHIDPYEGSGDGDSESVNSHSGLGTGNSFSTRSITSELRDDIEIVYFPKDAILVEQGERNPGLYYVIDGFLDASIPAGEKNAEDMSIRRGGSGQSSDILLPPLQRLSSGTHSPRRGGRSPSMKRTQARKSLFLIKPGGLAGYVGTISSYRSFVDVRAKTDVYVGFLPRASLELMVEKYPVVLLTMAKRLTSLLPRLILHIDFALEWVQINAGQVIHHQGDESDAIYIVLNGRLRAILEGTDGDMRVVGEYGQGESVGELEVTCHPRYGARQVPEESFQQPCPRTSGHYHQNLQDHRSAHESFD